MHCGDEELDEHADRLRRDRNDAAARGTLANISVEMIGVQNSTIAFVPVHFDRQPDDLSAFARPKVTIRASLNELSESSFRNARDGNITNARQIAQIASQAFALVGVIERGLCKIEEIVSRYAKVRSRKSDWRGPHAPFGNCIPQKDPSGEFCAPQLQTIVRTGLPSAKTARTGCLTKPTPCLRAILNCQSQSWPPMKSSLKKPTVSRTRARTTVAPICGKYPLIMNLRRSLRPSGHWSGQGP